jgi:hypothetical protein
MLKAPGNPTEGNSMKTLTLALASLLIGGCAAGPVESTQALAARPDAHTALQIGLAVYGEQCRGEPTVEFRIGAEGGYWDVGTPGHELIVVYVDTAAEKYSAGSFCHTLAQFAYATHALSDIPGGEVERPAACQAALAAQGL